MLELLAQAADKVDPTGIVPNITPTPGNALYLAIGAALVWLLKSGYLEKWVQWRKEDKQETREEAKEAPEREVKLLRESLDETKFTLKGVIAELIEQREKRHNCEVEVAEFRAELKHERAEKEELKQEVADQKKEIEELREQIKANVGDWKLLKKDVRAVQEHQDQQDTAQRTSQQ